MNKNRILFIGMIMFLIITSLSSAKRIHTDTPVESGLDYMIPEWNKLPFKDQRYNSSWIDYINSAYGVAWQKPENPRVPKCLSYGAATVNDWVKLATGMTLGNYSNFINNRTENGTSPRLLEAIYHDSNPSSCFISPTGTYCYARFLDDGVTGERIPFNTKGYVDLLTNPPTDWFNKPDPEISAFEYNLTDRELLEGYKYQDVSTNSEKLKDALRRYGVVYAHMTLFEIPEFFLPLHAITLVGYNDSASSTDFWAHDSYDGVDFSEFSRYSILDQSEIDTAWVVYDPQWPTDHHDYRRTGFTLLKGDMNETDDVEKIDIVLEDDLTSDIVLRPSVADLDGNGYMDTVTVMHDTYDANKTTLYIIERNKKFEYKGYGFWWQTEEKYNQNLGSSSMLLPPTLGNIDGDTRKEIILGLRNGTIMVLDVNEDGTAVSKWNYSLPEKYSGVAADYLVELGGGSAIADIDLDGTNEIILTDKGTTSTYDWPGEVYIIDGSGSSASIEGNYSFGNGGAYASVSVANIDDDDNPEIIVPSFYGIYAFDYNSSATYKLSKRWSNEDGLILGSAVLYDVDRDNEYELVYVTTERGLRL